jgi:peptidoglycan/LPS O-acetylase OafA/YrhL
LTALLVLEPRNPAPAPGQARPPLLSALTSVRFFAAFHVLLYHFLPPWRDRGPFAWLIGSGYTGVSFFFALSGFILVYSHAAEYLAGRGSPLRFYFARFARVYPC